MTDTQIVGLCINTFSSAGLRIITFNYSAIGIAAMICHGPPHGGVSEDACQARLPERGCVGNFKTRTTKRRPSRGEKKKDNEGGVHYRKKNEQSKEI